MEPQAYVETVYIRDMFYVHTYIHTDIKTYRHTEIHTDRQTGRQAGRQTDRHTYIHTHTYIYACMHTYLHTYLHTYIPYHTVPYRTVPYMHGCGDVYSTVQVPESWVWDFKNYDRNACDVVPKPLSLGYLDPYQWHNFETNMEHRGPCSLLPFWRP